MSIAIGALSQVSVGSNSVVVSSPAATGGVAPYTYQLYMSTTTGFSPGAGSLVAGATALSNTVTGLNPNVTYYFKMVATDSTAATATSAQLVVVTAATTLNPNQFAQIPISGMVDLRFDYDTVAVQIDPAQATPLYAGMAVKVTQTSLSGTPMVIGCALDTDEVFGFINFDIKTIAFNAGSRAEISQAGNVMYLYSTGAIARGSQVTLDLLNGGVAQATGSSGNKIVGWAYDGAAASGVLMRVKLGVPSFLID